MASGARHELATAAQGLHTLILILSFVQCARQAGKDRELTAAAAPGSLTLIILPFAQCARQFGQDGELTAAAEPGLHAFIVKCSLCNVHDRQGKTGS